MLVPIWIQTRNHQLNISKRDIDYKIKLSLIIFNSNANIEVISRKNHKFDIKNQKMETLSKIVENLHLTITSQDKKPQILEKITSHYDQVALKPIVMKKTSANDVSLIEIGKSIKREFNNNPEMISVTHALIENQISPIATRMKTIQGLLAQYFIMTNDDIKIEFISSSNKLRNVVVEPKEEQTPSQKYKQHKVDSVIYTKQLLEKNEEFKKWLPILDTSKKDDLADCFLQGIWYINKNGI